MRQDAVDGVGVRRADRAAGLVARAEHEVVDEELGATVEELRQSPRALVGLEPVLLLDRDPRQLAALPCELVAHTSVFLLASQQLLAGSLPFLAAADLVIRHRGCLLFVCALTPKTAAGAETHQA
jgi:hypothetical protein